MSVYACLDGDAEGGEQVGSVTGWGDFGRWADTLDAAEYKQVVHVAEHGWSQDLPAMEEQLADAVDETPPEDADTLDVVKGLQRILAGRGDADVMTITDGLTPN